MSTRGSLAQWYAFKYSLSPLALPFLPSIFIFIYFFILFEGQQTYEIGEAKTKELFSKNGVSNKQILNSLGRPGPLEEIK